MKKVIAVITKNGSEGTDVCSMMASADPSTAFPGCWEITEVIPEVTERISSLVNEFIDAPVFNRVIFGCSEAAADDIIACVKADVKRVTVQELAMYL